jgi:hypothetical protein
MAQELKTKSTPAIQHNSSNLAHHWRYFESNSRVIRDNSRAIRDNWRYGASHRQILPILPPNHFVEPPDSNWTTFIYLRMQVAKITQIHSFSHFSYCFSHKYRPFTPLLLKKSCPKDRKNIRIGKKNFITGV